MPSVIQAPYRIFKKISVFIENILALFPAFRFFRDTRNDEYPIHLGIWFSQKFLGKNGAVYWPVHPSSLVTFQQRILIGKGVMPGYQYGCFLHGVNRIYIGDYTFIAPNVGIMSGNHDVFDLRKQTSGKPIIIGKYCWLGMNSMILPEVILGDFTIVGAGTIVTKSFEEGYCVIAGNPARIIKRLEPSACIRYEKDFKYIGYIPLKRFQDFKNRELDV